MILESPAKINLGLEVHHRRPEDGYHYIASIFVPVYPGDRIHIEPSDTIQLKTENHLSGISKSDFERVASGSGIKENLAWKALEVLARHTGQSYSVVLEKHIPTGAGLGGGSSNAGVILSYGSRLGEISQETLESEALQLGADVPFFLNPVPSLVTGTGEIRKPIPFGELFGVLCNPGIHVNTKLAYQNLKRALQHAPPPRSLSSLTEKVASALVTSNWALASPLENHFESVVFMEHPVLGYVKRSFLSEGALFSSLSGSGSAVYGLVSNRAEELELREKMGLLYPEFTFRSIQSHPLRQGD